MMVLTEKDGKYCHRKKKIHTIQMKSLFSEYRKDKKKWHSTKKEQKKENEKPKK